MPNSKRAVVTGGANGIGQAFSKRLAAQGAKVAVADIADGGQTVGVIKNKGGSAFASIAIRRARASGGRCR